jgi:hypothetical protein
MPEQRHHSATRDPVRSAPAHPKLDDTDNADVELDAQELVQPVPDEPLGYGYGEWTSSPPQPLSQPVPESFEHENFAGRGPRRYQRSDEQIYEKICDRLTDDPRIDASELEVDVHNGEVGLRGHVPTREMRRLAEDIALDVSGVRHVMNDARIAAPHTINR